MKERYRKMLEEVHAPDRLRTEVMNMAEQKNRKRLPLKPLLIAAVLIAALTGTVVATGAGFTFVRFFNGGLTTPVEDPETGEITDIPVVYDVGGDEVIYFSVEELSEEVREAAEDCGDTGYVMENRATWEMMEEFIGLEIANSQILAYRGGRQTMSIQMGDEPVKSYQHMIILHGVGPGRIDVIVAYLRDGVRICLDVCIMTDAIEPEYRYGYYWGRLDYDGGTWSREDYLTANELETVIMHGPSDIPIYGAYMCEGLFILNGMGYYVQARGDDEEQVVTVLKEVLDGFQV